jgi:tetratricopeptide (TPR) repeat protein
LIFDLLTSLRSTFSPTTPPPTYLAILDLCRTAAIKVQDNQALQFTGNQYFNCGNAFFKAGLRKEAKNLLEKSLELDFSPIPSQNEQTAEEKAKVALARCRKLEMLGECCGKGEEKDSFALILEALNVHLTSLDIAKDSAVMSLSQIAKKEEYLTRLVGALTKFSRDQGDWSPGDISTEINEDFSIVLNDDLPPEVRAIAYEMQVNILLGMNFPGQYGVARSLCLKAMDIYQETDYPIRRARVTERLLYLAVLSGNDSDNLLEFGTVIVRSLTTVKVLRS